MRTYSPKAGDADRKWHVIDAQDVVLGRLATHAAVLLRGKHKATFAPHMDMGDFVIVINAEKIALSGNKATTKFTASSLKSTQHALLKRRSRECFQRTV
jgi:large subunit ribosomal protein L13